MRGSASLADFARGILHLALNGSLQSLDFFPPSLGACLQAMDLLNGIDKLIVYGSFKFTALELN